MSIRLLVALLITAGGIALLTVVAVAQPASPSGIPSGVQAGGDPLTVDLNLGGNPLTLDPAKAGDAPSTTVIQQLFAGLVGVDDATGEVRPELAGSWAASPDRSVYTFTLRSDAFWSDGHPITAEDVRYGILRSLDPSTASPYSYTLSIIKNAAPFAGGAITDPNQVGLLALDDTHLRVTLERAASYALAILALPNARPAPKWAIDEWGNAWTDPAHIVTSGAYRLTAVYSQYILLDKSAAYFGAPGVQIQRVRMWIVANENTAWSMYLNGELDTARVPVTATLDPIQRQEVRVAPAGATYYVGFSASQPPFNNPLVRKAFAAASDRRGLAGSVLGGRVKPALTFTPPGIFGAVDGAAEGVGIPYDPNQARLWLAQAGYPNGQGLPPVTLWYNSPPVPGHRATMEYLRDGWYATLGVSVTLQTLPWTNYLGQLNGGLLQSFRLGWNADYPDANNFLGDAILGSRSTFGNWQNAEYDSLIGQAAREEDPAARKALYKRAEEILVETDPRALALLLLG